MTTTDFDSRLLCEAKLVTKISNLDLGEIVEWASGTIIPRRDETRFYLPNLRLNIALKTVTLERKKCAK